MEEDGVKWSVGGVVDIMMSMCFVVKMWKNIFVGRSSVPKGSQRYKGASCTGQVQSWMLKYLQIHSLRWAEFAVSRVVPDLVNNVWSFAEKRWQPHEFSDKELLRQIKLHQEAPQQPEEAAISVASA